MVKRFVASSPSNQPKETYRQFRDLQVYLAELENRLAPDLGNGDVDPQPVLDDTAWTELTISNEQQPKTSGIFWTSLRLGMTGSNPNSWVQLRMTWGGVGDVPAGELIGAETTIGNHDLMSVTMSGALPVGVNVMFWIRGDRTTVLSGRLNLMRIGLGEEVRG